MTELLPNIFAIEVPRGTTALSLAPHAKEPYILQSHISGAFGEIPLPFGSYEILFTTKGVAEEQASGVVGRTMADLFENYDTMWDLSGFEGYDKATESLQSLLKSKGLTAENYLIIKKVEG